MTLGGLLFVCLMIHIYTGCHLSNTINTSWIQTHWLINTSNTHTVERTKHNATDMPTRFVVVHDGGKELQGSLSTPIEFTNSLFTWEREWVCTHRCGEKSYSSRHIEMRLSSPQRYPSSWFPSSQGVRWSTWIPGGTSTVLPKSIICIPLWPELS